MEDKAMNILVLNGSPKGEMSVTMQYVEFLRVTHPEAEWNIRPVALEVQKLERNPAAWNQLMEEVKAANAVLWAFPLYFGLCSSQYKRFIELIHERKCESVFQGKAAAALTTSIKYFDHTAHSYIRAVSEDLSMRFFDGYSADMQDMEKEEERYRLNVFGDALIRFIDSPDAGSMRQSAILPAQTPVYRPSQMPKASAARGKTVRIITDAAPEDQNLIAMTEQMKAAFSGEAEVLNLRDLDWKNGCLGCLHCGNANVCAYEGKDGFTAFFRDKVITSDILVFAGTVKDRNFSHLWRRFFDRSFFLNHQPKLTGIQLIWLVSGPLSQMGEMKEWMTGYTENEGSNLCAMISDESDSANIDSAVAETASRAVAFAEAGYVRPKSFQAVGGHKIFRDAIFGPMRSIFMEDHRSLKRRKGYDFPQKNIGIRIFNALVAPLIHMPPVWEKFAPMIKEGMIAPYQKVLKKQKAE